MLSIGVDSLFYGDWVLVPLNFIKFNLVRGISSFYGIHSWYWYLTQGIPVVSLTFLPLILWTLVVKNTKLKGFFMSTIVILSLVPHKEFRFILPLLPPALACAGQSIYSLEVHFSKKTSSKFIFNLILILLTITNLFPALYIGVVHQRGAIDVMNWLRRETQSPDRVKSILFLMPCHSTPFYSYLHKNIPMSFLTCEPPLK